MPKQTLWVGCLTDLGTYFLPCSLCSERYDLDCYRLDLDFDNVTIRNKGNNAAPVTDNEGSNCTHTDDDPKQNKLIDAISERVLSSIRLKLPAIFWRVLNKELSIIKTDIQELRKSVEFISEAHDDYKRTTDTLVKDNTYIKR